MRVVKLLLMITLIFTIFLSTHLIVTGTPTSSAIWIDNEEWYRYNTTSVNVPIPLIELDNVSVPLIASDNNDHTTFIVVTKIMMPTDNLTFNISALFDGANITNSSIVIFDDSPWGHYLFSQKLPLNHWETFTVFLPGHKYKPIYVGIKFNGQGTPYIISARVEISPQGNGVLFVSKNSPLVMSYSFMTPSERNLTISGDVILALIAIAIFILDTIIAVFVNSIGIVETVFIFVSLTLGSGSLVREYNASFFIASVVFGLLAGSYRWILDRVRRRNRRGMNLDAIIVAFLSLDMLMFLHEFRVDAVLYVGVFLFLIPFFISILAIRVSLNTTWQRIFEGIIIPLYAWGGLLLIFTWRFAQTPSIEWGVLFLMLFLILPSLVASLKIRTELLERFNNLIRDNVREIQSVYSKFENYSDYVISLVLTPGILVLVYAIGSFIKTPSENDVPQLVGSSLMLIIGVDALLFLELWADRQVRGVSIIGRGLRISLAVVLFLISIVLFLIF